MTSVNDDYTALNDISHPDVEPPTTTYSRWDAVGTDLLKALHHLAWLDTIRYTPWRKTAVSRAMHALRAARRLYARNAELEMEVRELRKLKAAIETIGGYLHPQAPPVEPAVEAEQEAA